MQTRNSSYRGLATAVRLLVVLLLVIVLIIPRINSTPSRAVNVKQVAQLHSIDVGLELFNDEWRSYPPSGVTDSAGDLETFLRRGPGRKRSEASVYTDRPPYVSHALQSQRAFHF